MRHVFVETNWLVAVGAPAHNQTLAALELLEQARRDIIRIYLPACCIAEARKTIRQKFQPKEADRLRKYLRWAVEERRLDDKIATPARTALQSFEEQATSELSRVNERLQQISTAPGLELVPLDDDILARCVELYFKEIEPSDFDRAVLAAVLTKGMILKNTGADDVNFCQLDSKLWPWEKKTRHPRSELKNLYDAAGVWVYSDFTLSNPERPADFSDRIP